MHQSVSTSTIKSVTTKSKDDKLDQGTQGNMDRFILINVPSTIAACVLYISIFQQSVTRTV